MFSVAHEAAEHADAHAVSYRREPRDERLAPERHALGAGIAVQRPLPRHRAPVRVAAHGRVVSKILDALGASVPGEVRTARVKRVRQLGNVLRDDIPLGRPRAHPDGDVRVLARQIGERVPHVHSDADAGVLGAKRSHDGRKNGGEVVDGREAHRSGEGFVTRGQLAPRFRRLFVHRGRVGQKLLPGVRQRVTARASREEARAQRFFQPCDAAVNGRRVDAQGCRCRRQASAPRDGQE